MKNCYVYAVFRPDGRICYIGKGTGERWKRHASRARANPHYAAILKSAGGDLPTVIISSGLSEPEAYEIENLLTGVIGLEKDGGPLINCGHGGKGGPSGVKRSDEWRAVRSLRAKEAWQNPETRAKLLDPGRNRGGNKKPRSDSFKAAVSEAMRGNKHTLGFQHTPEAKAKMSASGKGRVLSDEHREKIRAANTGRKRGPLSAEHRAKMSKTLTGRKLSADTRAKMSAAQKGKKKPPIRPEVAQRLATMFLGRKHSAESRAKMSEARKRGGGRPHTDESRAKLAAAGRGRRHSPETLAKMSEAQTQRYAKLRAGTA